MASKQWATTAFKLTAVIIAIIIMSEAVAASQSFLISRTDDSFTIGYSRGNNYAPAYAPYAYAPYAYAPYAYRAYGYYSTPTAVHYGIPLMHTTQSKYYNTYSYADNSYASYRPVQAYGGYAYSPAPYLTYYYNG